MGRKHKNLFAQTAQLYLTLRMEIFVTIKAFPDYEVSNFGRVKTKSRQIRYTHSVTGEEHFRLSESKFLKVQHNNRTGYKFHQLYLDKKMYNVTIHKLVAEAFLEKIDGKNYINHIDGNKHNNIVENLEWCTNEYNHEHATKTGLKPSGSRVGTAKLNERMIGAIKYLAGIGLSHNQIAEAFQISRANVSTIFEGKAWKKALTGEELNIKL